MTTTFEVQVLTDALHTAEGVAEQLETIANVLGVFNDVDSELVDALRGAQLSLETAKGALQTAVLAVEEHGASVAAEAAHAEFKQALSEMHGQVRLPPLFDH